MANPESDATDLTPVSGSPTDVARTGREEPVPSHEATAEGASARYDWNGIAEAPEFRALVANKLRFIIPTTVFFTLYYIALPLLVGWHPDLMKSKVMGVNLAYWFALSQFFMAWIIAAIYVVKAGYWDRAAAAVLAKFNLR